MDTRESPGRTRLLASGLLVLTLAAGALGGVATERALNARQPGRTQAPRAQNGRDRERPGGRIPSIFLDTLVFGRIGATSEQRQNIEAILARRDREASALWAQIGPSLDSMVKQTRGEIRAQLSAEQLAKLDQIFKERYEKHRRDRQRNEENKPRP